jgi:hypothetical protein
MPAPRKRLKRSKKLSSEEAELPTPAHIGHDFDRTAKIGIGMPR